MVEYREAFKRPFTHFRRVVLGIIFSAVPIVNFISAGYVLECARTFARKEYDLPKLTQPADLFTNGFFAVLVGLLYSIPFLALSYLFTGVTIAPFLSPFRADYLGVLFSLGMGAQFILTVVFLLTAYLLPNGILAYTFHGTVRSAFVFDRIKERSLDSVYAKNWLIVAVVYAVLIAIFAQVPIVGVCIATFLASIVGLSILGEVYADY